MALVFALLNFAFLSWLVVRSIKTSSLTFFFWVGLLVPFGMPAIYDSIVAPIQSSPEVVFSAILYAIYLNIVVAATMFFVSHFVLSRNKSEYRFGRPLMGAKVSDNRSPAGVVEGAGPVNGWTREKPLAELISGRNIPQPFLRVLLVVQLVGFMLIALDISRATGKPFWHTYNMHWHIVAFEERGPFMTLGSYLSILGASLCTVAWLQRRWLFFFGSVLIAIMICLTTGARYLIIPALMPVIFVALVKKMEYKKLIGLTLVGFAMALLIYQIQTLRWLNDRRLVRLFDPEAVSFSLQRIKEAFGGGGGAGEFDLRFGYYFYFEHIPSEMPFANGQTYLRILMMPLPGFLVPGIKPRELTQVLCELRYGASSAEGSTDHPLFYGETWANSGLFGALIGIFWGTLFALLDWWFRKRHVCEQVLLLSPIAAFMVFLARGAVYSSSGFLFVGGAIGLLISGVWYRGFVKSAKRSTTLLVGTSASLRAKLGVRKTVGGRHVSGRVQ